MPRLQFLVAVAAAAAALATAAPAQAETVCVTEPALSDVYSGCTTVNRERRCVSGSGAVLGSRYAIACSPR